MIFFKFMCEWKKIVIFKSRMCKWKLNQLKHVLEYFVIFYQKSKCEWEINILNLNINLFAR